MRKQWTETENEIFSIILDRYRDDIRGKDKKQVKKVTRIYAEKLYSANQILQSRTIQSVDEHLSYFDDLTAGVGSKEDFAKKDEKYYGKIPRSDNSFISNPARVIRSKEKYLK
ncbi:hypothetical protein [Fictibacillus terranigra]|uniref:Uncharacterized protein n=1 Tax=Fictibacillus terranigra TaxID=3058424 RepID=A0ABT8E589_9BACL|nr:hypothetical protein [Fictibacillus sp. CENA-BCM004]MDN4073079.1 hypothetical protein [Fictibacillus sp. CENA-BCM004]